MSSPVPPSGELLLPEDWIFPDGQNNWSQYDVTLRQSLGNISSTVNSKNSGLYSTEETLTGGRYPEQYISFSSSSTNFPALYRKTFIIPSLPNNTTLQIATETEQTKFFKMYGCANLLASGVVSRALPIPNTYMFLEYISPNIEITTSADYTDWEATIVLEFIKD